MNNNKLFNISEFALISGVSRQTLIYYDKIGLFSPIYIKDNGYRLYSHSQIGIISIISIFSDLGVPLKELKKIIQNINPYTSEKILSSQLELVKSKIKKLSLLEKMISLRLNQLHIGEEALSNNLEISIIDIKEDIPFFLGEVINVNKDDISDNQMMSFFNLCERKDIPLVFALGYIKRKEDVVNNDISIVHRLCFRLKNKESSNGTLVKGKYLVTYALGDYGKTDYIYKTIFQYLKDNNLAINSDIYEEYLYDELIKNNPDEYLLQISFKID